MRTKYQLWKVSNGWLLVPEGKDGQIMATDAPNCIVFRNLKEFADYKPKRERKSRATPKPKTVAMPVTAEEIH
jgi:hypothetical protein